MLKNLFISKVRVKMLKQFLFNEGEEYHVRGLVRILDEEINAVRRELQNLEEAGILLSQRKGNKLFYRINSDCFLLDELTSMMYKDREDIKKVYKSIKKIEGVDVALVTKSFIKNEYEDEMDIDILFVGDIKVNDATQELKKLEKSLDKELRITVMKRTDLDFHLKKRDKFLLNILQKDNILLIGSYKNLA
jgi:predicted transcriptional regulator